MEENKIPTAEKFFEDISEVNTKQEFIILINRVKEFAKLHVKASLKAAAERGVIKKTDAMPDAKRYIDKNSILNAYPETNIK